MKYQMELTNLQVFTLYNFLKKSVLSRPESAKRWNFLRVFKKSVLDYEDKRNSVIRSHAVLREEYELEQDYKKKQDLSRKINKEVPEFEKLLIELAKVKKIYIFPDINAYDAMKIHFRQLGEESEKGKENQNTIKLKDDDGEIYYDIDQAFTEAKEIK